MPKDSIQSGHWASVSNILIQLMGTESQHQEFSDGAQSFGLTLNKVELEVCIYVGFCQVARSQ